ncbi:rubrerythrin [archaeon]|nr:rubrerythrin [archaeon]|tara:strand:+ start:1251 stop:1628 length:378 start_codon:yes stop_codon:yes gene_type:complete
MTKTDENLKAAFAGESQANRKYLAFAAKAMEEGLPEIAQLFMEAAGAETTHALNHFRVMNAIKTTKENVEQAAEGENDEIEEIYPRFIKQAKAEGRDDAVETFTIAMEREKYHREMFREALKKLK